MGPRLPDAGVTVADGETTKIIAVDEAGPCRWCAEIHQGEHCPLVKAIGLDVAGNIIRIEFLTPKDYAGDPASEPEPDYPRKKGV